MKDGKTSTDWNLYDLYTVDGNKGQRSDVNVDGSINVMDMLSIQDHILGEAIIQ